MTSVYIAACLAYRHPDVYFDLKKVLGTAGVVVAEVPDTRNIWIRDWMPIPVGDHFVKFRPKADVEKWSFLEVPDSAWRGPWTSLFTFPGALEYSDIILDGGNVVRSPDGKRVIMCEQTLRDNEGAKLAFDSWSLQQHLTYLLEARIIWIPNAPGDDLGHSDGEVAWIDDSTVFVNDYRAMRDPIYHEYERDIRRRIESAEADFGIECVAFPNAYDECRDIDEARFRREHPQADDFNMATGYYINFLKIDNLILYPTFGIDRDNRAADALIDAWPNATIAGIECRYLAEEGGLLHCITWEA